MASERLRVILEMVAGQYKSEARAAARATSEIADQSSRAGREGNFATRTFSKWGDEIKSFVALRAARAVKDVVVGSINAASELNESMNAVNKVFGTASDTINAFGQISAQAAGISTREFNQMATVTGAALTNLGFSYDEAAKQSIRLTTRAGDLASVFDTDVGTALDAINSSLAGQQRPLRQFGINLSDAEIRAKAVSLGLADTTAAVDDHGKAVATLELIYEESAAAQGDFLQTSDELANSQRRAAAAAENAQARFGQALQAPLAAAADMSATVLDSFTALGLFGDAQATVAQQSLRMSEAVALITSAFEAGTDPAIAFQNALLHMAENGELTTGAVEALAGAAGVAIDDADAFAESLGQMALDAGVSQETVDALTAAITGSGDAAAGAEGDHEGLAGALDEEAEGAEAAAASQLELLNIYKEAANPIFAAQRALERYNTAQEALTSAQEEGTSTAEDIAEAQLDVASAALEAEGALLALGEGDIQAGVNAIATALDISDQEARALLETLGVLDGTRVTSVVETKFVTSGKSPSVLRGDIGRVGGRQHGGPVTGGQPYIVGEAGPELFVPHTSGKILSNQVFNQQSRKLDVTFNNSSLANDPMQGIRAAFALDSLANV